MLTLAFVIVLVLLCVGSIVLLVTHLTLGILHVRDLHVTPKDDEPCTSRPLKRTKEFHVSIAGKFFIGGTCVSIFLSNALDVFTYSALVAPSLMLGRPLLGHTIHALIGQLATANQLASLVHVTTSSAASIIRLLELDYGEYEIIRSFLSWGWIFCALFSLLLNTLMCTTQVDLDRYALTCTQPKVPFAQTFWGMVSGLVALASVLCSVFFMLKRMGDAAARLEDGKDSQREVKKARIQIVHCQLSLLQVVFLVIYNSVFVANQLTHLTILPLCIAQTLLHVLSSTFIVLYYVRSFRLIYGFLKQKPPHKKRTLLQQAHKKHISQQGFRRLSCSNNLPVQHRHHHNDNDDSISDISSMSGPRKFEVVSSIEKGQVPKSILKKDGTTKGKVKVLEKLNKETGVMSTIQSIEDIPSSSTYEFKNLPTVTVEQTSKSERASLLNQASDSSLQDRISGLVLNDLSRDCSLKRRESNVSSVLMEKVDGIVRHGSSLTESLSPDELNQVLTGIVTENPNATINEEDESKAEKDKRNSECDSDNENNVPTIPTKISI